MLSTIDAEIFRRDRLFDQRFELGDFLLRDREPGARRRLEVDDELAGVGLGEVARTRAGCTADRLATKAEEERRGPPRARAERAAPALRRLRACWLNRALNADIEARSPAGVTSV